MPCTTASKVNPGCNGCSSPSNYCGPECDGCGIHLVDRRIQIASMSLIKAMTPDGGAGVIVNSDRASATAYDRSGNTFPLCYQQRNPVLFGFSHQCRDGQSVLTLSAGVCCTGLSSGRLYALCTSSGNCFGCEKLSVDSSSAFDSCDPFQSTHSFPSVFPGTDLPIPDFGPVVILGREESSRAKLCCSSWTVRDSSSLFGYSVAMYPIPDLSSLTATIQFSEVLADWVTGSEITSAGSKSVTLSEVLPYAYSYSGTPPWMNPAYTLYVAFECGNLLVTVSSGSYGEIYSWRLGYSAELMLDGALSSSEPLHLVASPIATPSTIPTVIIDE